MNFSHLLECMMLVCFGFSWPLNVVKAYKARTAKGTSLAFIFLIITGYLAGISAKFVNGQFNYVLVVYFLNLAIVSLNVFVYFRNKKLDRNAAKNHSNNSVTKLHKKDLKIDEKYIEDSLKISLSSEEFIPETKTSVAEETGAVILMGGTMDKKIPCKELQESFGFNFSLYNKSQENLSLNGAKEYFQKNILAMESEGIILHLGERDADLFKSSSSTFDQLYLDIIDFIKNANKKERIALVSVANPEHCKTVAEMNAHIKAIADSENLPFVNLESARLWNPEATKASSDFAYSMGLRTRKPLKNVCEILYSWAYKEFGEEKAINDEKIS